MQLNCQSCGAEILVNNVNLDHMIAKCEECNAVFSFAKEFGHDGAHQPAALKPQVERPKSMTVSDLGTELKITRRWFGPTFFFLAFFALFWNGITWTFVAAAVFSQQWVMLLFVSIHLLVGLGVAYAALTLLVNSTEIRVDRYNLSIWHGPLPAKKNRTVPADQITQIYCKEKIQHNRKSTSITYELYAITRANLRQELVTGLPSPEDAMFLEQEIERFLRVEDQPVRGEYSL